MVNYSVRMEYFVTGDKFSASRTATLVTEFSQPLKILIILWQVDNLHQYLSTKHLHMLHVTCG